MARNGSGTYNLLTNSWNPATNGVSATAVDWQNLINDVAAALTQSLSADGQTPMTGNLNAGNNKITGLAAGTGAGQSIRWEQVFTAPASFGGGAVNVDAAGNVGINGTPTDRLTVIGNMRIQKDVPEIRFRSIGDVNKWFISANISNIFDGGLIIGSGNDVGSGVHRLLIDSSGNVGIGTNPGQRLHVSNAGTTTIRVQTTDTSGTAVGRIQAAYTGGSGGVAAEVDLRAGDGYAYLVTTTNTPLLFGTNNVERLRINSSGNVLVTSPGGLGYGTGAGGTVTQSTNKTTSVTLNRPTGQIIMNNAALAANTSVVFSLVNSLISANDLVLPVCGPGVSGVNYRIEVVDISAGIVQIRVSNITGVSLSDSVVINFAIIKGSTT